MKSKLRAMLSAVPSVINQCLFRCQKSQEHRNPNSVFPEEVYKDGILHQPREFVRIPRFPTDEWGILCSCGFIHPLFCEYPYNYPKGTMLATVECCSCGQDHILYLEDGQLKVFITEYHTR